MFLLNTLTILPYAQKKKEVS